MSRTMEKKNKHMTLDERIEIQECLDKGMTFKAIGERIGKDQTTVSKEVKKHFEIYTNSFCKTDECCPKHLKAPFVCNGCPKRNHSNCKSVRRVVAGVARGNALKQRRILWGGELSQHLWNPGSTSITRSRRTIWPFLKPRYIDTSKNIIQSPKLLKK